MERMGLYLSRKKTEALYLFLGTTIITYLDFLVSLFYGNTVTEIAPVSFAFYIASALGYAMLYAAILLLIVYLPLSLACNERSRVPAITFTSVAILLQAIFIIDILVFSVYKFHLNANIIDLALKGGSEVFVFDYTLVLKVLALFIFAAVSPYLLVLFWSKMGRRRKPKTVIICSIVTLSSLTISAFSYIYAIRNERVDVIKTLQTIPFYQPKVMDKVLYFVSHDAVDQFMFQVIYGELDYPKQPIATSDSIPDYNIVYIVIDSWNPSAFTQEVSPHIYNFANTRAHQFTQHFSTSNATHYSVNSIFYSLPFNAIYFVDEQTTRPVMMDVLMKNNYQIQCFTSATMVNQYTFAGVENVKMNTEGNTPFERDTQVNKDFDLFLNQRKEVDNKQPFFSLLFYDLAHAISIPEEHRQQFKPSWNSPDYLSLNNAEARTPFFNLYKNCLHYVDKLVDEVIDKLEVEGLMENTVIVITGDHGQEFNENGKNFWGHYSNFSKWQLQVPFMIYYPEIDKPQTFNHLTTHNDIVPTILPQFLGVENAREDYSIGHDMYDTSNRYPIECGNYHSKAVLLDNYIITVNYEWGISEVTEKELNRVSKDNIDVSQLEKLTANQKHYFKDNSLIIK